MKTSALVKSPGWATSAVKRGAAALSDMRARLDSWANALTGLNTSRDKTTYTLPFDCGVLAPQMLETIYHVDDLANRIVSAMPDECFREPWTIINRTVDIDDDEAIQEQASQLEADCETFGVHEKLREAMTWGRLYGLGAVYLEIDDGQPSWEEIDWNRVRGVRAMTVLDKRDLTPWRWYADPRAPKFGDVAIYLMQPVGVFVGAPYDLTAYDQLILVHESRLVRFGGELTSKRRRLANQGSDYSVLQRCYRALQLTNDNWQSAAAMMSDASQGVFTIKGLIDMISQQPDVMTSRFAFMDMARSSLRAIVLDSDGEKFERVPSRFEGIPNMLDQTWTRLCAAARMPKTVMMGTSPGGLNATGESDIRWWYDTVAATQEHAVKPALCYILRLLAAGYGWDNAQDWSVMFAPLWQMSEKELAETHFQQAQADSAYIDRGVLVPEEVALNRFGSVKYSMDTQIDVEPRKKVLQLSHEQSEIEAETDLENAKNPPEPVELPGVVSTGAPAKSRATPNTPDPRPSGVVEE